jgi:secernin
VEHAIEKGWWPRDQKQRFDFARAYIDEVVPRQVSHVRMQRTRQLLKKKAGHITPGWMMRIARDHYEGSFLGGPLFDAADPDFHTICMHASPAAFTWGNTASSCVAVLSDPSAGLPVFWWTPGPPCNGCYVPFFVHGSRLPEIVTRAGTAGKTVTPPKDATEDAFDAHAYWWLFRRLIDRVKGDPVRSLPGYYERNNPLVRERFDALEQAFARRLPEVLAEAALQREKRDGIPSRVLDEFTVECVNEVTSTVHELLAELV